MAIIEYYRTRVFWAFQKTTGPVGYSGHYRILQDQDILGISEDYRTSRVFWALRNTTGPQYSGHYRILQDKQSVLGIMEYPTVHEHYSIVQDQGGLRITEYYRTEH